jgi:ABC-type transport system involved in multi-copper enzyme maturation permease subunit
VSALSMSAMSMSALSMSALSMRALSMSPRRVRAIFRKELRDYRRNGQVVGTMIVLPLIFVIPPLLNIFALPARSAALLQHGDPLLYMLGIPALVPAVIAAYSVVGERQQGTLEPVLTTPISREEFVLGKALSALIPSAAASCFVYALTVAAIGLFAQHGIAAALLRGQDVLAQLIFTPLLAGWSIWLGIAISARSSDIRVAQQFGMLANLPSVAVVTLVAYNVIHPSLRLALAAGAVLLTLNALGWRFASAAFGRERLIVGAR